MQIRAHIHVGCVERTRQADEEGGHGQVLCKPLQQELSDATLLSPLHRHALLEGRLCRLHDAPSAAAHPAVLRVARGRRHVPEPHPHPRPLSRPRIHLGRVQPLRPLPNPRDYLWRHASRDGER